MLIGPGLRVDEFFLDALTSEEIVRVSSVSQPSPFRMTKHKRCRSNYLPKVFWRYEQGDKGRSGEEQVDLESVSFIDATFGFAEKDDGSLRLKDGSGRLRRLPGRA